MHIAHHQFYWEQKNQNAADSVVWTRRDYVNHVTAKLIDKPTISPFLYDFRTAKTPPRARQPRDRSTPNDRSRGPPKTREDERVAEIRQTMAERFKQGMEKEARKAEKKRISMISSSV
jgi:arylamine N-acetyltransferase